MIYSLGIIEFLDGCVDFFEIIIDIFLNVGLAIYNFFEVITGIFALVIISIPEPFRSIFLIFSPLICSLLLWKVFKGG